jgi:hypothetical protein
MLKWFRYDHLPKDLQAVSKPFSALAAMIVMRLKPGAERTVALRKLLNRRTRQYGQRLKERNRFDRCCALQYRSVRNQKTGPGFLSGP